MTKRILTAIAAFLIFIPLVVMGGTAFNALVYLLASMALWELIRMYRIKGYVPVIFAMISLWFLLLPDTADIVWKTELITLTAFLLLAYTVIAKNTFTFDDAGFLLLAIIYVGMGFFYFMNIRNGTSTSGLIDIFYVLLVIWTTDTGAYFCGRAFGKRKLWPAISPNKTVEGAASGIILAVIVGIVYHMVFSFAYDTITVIALTIFVSIAAQIGDLVASAYKRYYNVKDSGKLLPGHGGVLDRLDSLIFVLPLLHLLHFFS